MLHALDFRRLALVAVMLGVTPLASTVHAQVRASERARVSQTADGTTIIIDYARPRARGRGEIFGKVVHMGEVWTPGANWATTLEASRDLAIDGHAVKKGKYSVWFVVGAGAWTVILDPRHQRYHMEVPDSTAEQVRWTVTPTEAPPAEILTWSFPEVRPDGMVLHFAWGTKQVAMNATVQSSHPIPIARAAAEPFLGTYRWKWEPEMQMGTDEARLTLYYEDGRIKQRHDPYPKWYTRLQDQPMVRINDTWFLPTIVRDGKVVEMDSDLVFEFEVKDGKAVSFELRDSKDNLMGKGTRVQ